MEWREREKAWNRSCPNECKVSHGGSLFLYPKKFRPTSLAVLVHAHWRISARFIARQKMVGIVSHARVFQFSKTWRYFSFVILWIKRFSYITWRDCGSSATGTNRRIGYNRKSFGSIARISEKQLRLRRLYTTLSVLFKHWCFRLEMKAFSTRLVTHVVTHNTVYESRFFFWLTPIIITLFHWNVKWFILPFCLVFFL
jgi:hypothetical protein